MFSSYFVSVLGRETLEDHSQLPKKANICSVGVVVSFMVASRVEVRARSRYNARYFDGIARNRAPFSRAIDAVSRPYRANSRENSGEKVGFHLMA